jgi:hypothetical protein
MTGYQERRQASSDIHHQRLRSGYSGRVLDRRLMGDAVDRIFEMSNEISGLIDKINTELLLLSEDYPSREQLAEIAYSLHAVKSQASELFSTAEEGIAPTLGQEPFVLANGATVESKTGGARKKWDHAGLGAEVSKRIVDSSFDMDTGEMRLSHEEMVQEVLRYAAPSYWRVGKLKERGIDSNQYCQLDDPITRIVVRRAK